MSINRLKLKPLLGVNLMDDPSELAHMESGECELAWAKNLFPTKKKLLSKRSVLGFEARFNGYGAQYPLAALIPPYESPTQLVMIGQGQSDGHLYINTLYSELDAANSVDLGLASAYQGRPIMFSFRRKVYVLPGYPYNFAALIIDVDSTALSGSSITAFQFSGTGNLFAPKVGCIYQGRAVYGNLGPGYENDIVFSDTGQPSLLGDDCLSSTTPFRATVGGTDGDAIVAMIEIMQTSVGNPSTSALLILKNHSCHILTGNPQESNFSTGKYFEGDTPVSIAKTSFDCGCASPYTVATTPWGTIWAGHDNVWFFREGAAPYPIGTKLGPALGWTAASLRNNWDGAYHDGVYRLALFDDGQNMATAPAKGSQWWLDLRGGPPQGYQDAKWWGPQQFLIYGAADGLPTQGTRCFAQDTRPAHPRKLFAVEVIGAVETVDFNYVQLLEYDVPGARDVSNKTFSPYRTQGNEIVVEGRTRIYDFEQGVLKKQFLGLYADVSVGGNTQLEADVDIDQGVRTATCVRSIEGTGFVLDVDVLDSVNMNREFQGVGLFPLDSGLTYAGGDLQVTVKDNPGILVIDGLNTFFAFSYGGNSLVATLTPGLYVDLRTFLDALTSAMSTVAGLGVVFTHNQTGYPRSTPYVAISTTSGPWFALFASADALYLRSTKLIGALLGYPVTINEAPATISNAVDYWRLIEASGTAVADLGTAATALTANGATSASSTGRNFNTVGARAQGTPATTALKTVLRGNTWFVDFYYTPAATGYGGRIFTLYGIGTLSGLYSEVLNIGIDDGGLGSDKQLLVTYNWNGGSGLTRFSSTQLTLGVQTHITLEWSKPAATWTLVIKFNGVTVATHTGLPRPDEMTTAGTVALGSLDGISGSSQGKLTEFRISDTATILYSQTADAEVFYKQVYALLFNELVLKVDIVPREPI